MSETIDVTSDADEDDAATLAALGVTVKDTASLEAQYRADWERAAEERERERQRRRKQPTVAAAEGSSADAPPAIAATQQPLPPHPWLRARRQPLTLSSSNRTIFGAAVIA